MTTNDIQLSIESINSQGISPTVVVTSHETDVQRLNYMYSLSKEQHSSDRDDDGNHFVSDLLQKDGHGFHSCCIGQQQCHQEQVVPPYQHEDTLSIFLLPWFPPSAENLQRDLVKREEAHCEPRHQT